MHTKASLVAAAGLASFATALNASSTTETTGNILPTSFPVSMFPVTTQTHFDSPSCTEAASATQSFTVNYNFETVERGVPIVALTEIKEYNLLSFNHINYVNTDPDFDGNHLGLAPYTYPSVAAFNGLTAALDDIFSPSAPSITANYTESTVDSFTPHYFWYGCVAPFPYTAGSLPEACNITAIGYGADGKQVASQKFGFQANGSVVQDQIQGKFHSGFANVRSISFGVNRPLAAAALVDNFVATLYQKACAPLYTGSYNNGM